MTEHERDPCIPFRQSDRDHLTEQHSKQKALDSKLNWLLGLVALAVALHFVDPLWHLGVLQVP